MVDANTQLIALGINHNSAQVELRERVAFSPEQVPEALNDACRVVGLDEVVLLSTCNRTEVYAVAAVGSGPDSEAHSQSLSRALIEWLAGYHHMSATELEAAAYEHKNEAALRHIVQVAAGLDSMLLGEPQIFGQLKSAYAVANEAGTVSTQLGRLFPRIFSVAKKVRTDTAIGENPVSVAYAAVDLARRIFTDPRECRALLIGAGETIELVARHLLEAGVTQIVIANRTLGRAKDLAQQFGADAVLLAEIPQHLPNADIVISSTASQLPIIGKGTVESAIKARRHRPMLMVDIAVPRDIESQVADLRDVYLYSVDDLRQIVDSNLQARQSEVSKADDIIREGIANIGDEQRALGAVDLVKQYRSSAESLRQRELDRALTAINRGEDAQQVLAELARSLTNKLIHAPTVGLRKASAEGRNDVLHHAAQLLDIPQATDLSSATDASSPVEDAVVSAKISRGQTLQ